MAFFARLHGLCPSIKEQCTTRKLHCFRSDEFGFDFSWDPTNRFSLDLKTSYRNYDYPNAFAFHNPLGGVKSLETIRARFNTEYRITPRFSVSLDADYHDSSSSDTRINYDRTWFTLGFTWKQ